MRLTTAVAVVLDAFAHGATYGFEIIEVTGLQAGTVYPILRRLEEAGMLRARWEATAKAHAEGRPPRRMYQLTSAGAVMARQARARLPLLRQPADGREYGPEGA